jgi:transposase
LRKRPPFSLAKTGLLISYDSRLITATRRKQVVDEVAKLELELGLPCLSHLRQRPRCHSESKPEATTPTSESVGAQVPRMAKCGE